MLNDMCFLTGAVLIAFAIAGLFSKKSMIFIFMSLYNFFLGFLVLCAPIFTETKNEEAHVFLIVFLVLTMTVVPCGLALFRRRSQQTRQVSIDDSVQLRH